MSERKDGFFSSLTNLLQQDYRGVNVSGMSNSYDKQFGGNCYHYFRFTDSRLRSRDCWPRCVDT